MDDKDRIHIGFIGGGRQGGKTTLVQAIAKCIEPEVNKPELTWEDIKKDFDTLYPNTAALVDDYRPYSAYMIQLWLKTGAHITYNYYDKRVGYLKLPPQK